MVFMDNIIELAKPVLAWHDAHPWFAALVLGVVFLVFVGFEIRDGIRRTKTLRYRLGCPFCEVAQGRPVTRVVRTWRDAIALEPLNPVVPGHLIFISRWHVSDAGQDPKITAQVMRRVAEYIAEHGGQHNIITSLGRDATQTVFHLHIHLVPRREGDGLHLPWTGQVVEQVS